MAPKQSKPLQTDWSRIVPDLGRFVRPLHVSLPCVGIDGAGFALKALKVPFAANNVYDLEKRYKKHLEEHLASSKMHLGKDITEVELKDFERPVDLLISGPPCPPWAGNGKHQGIEDRRAHVFISVMKLVLSLVKIGDLKACVIENVKGILSKHQGTNVSFMDYIVKFLQERVPEFDWHVVTMKAQDYMLAQQRTRVFLRGMRKCYGDGVVPPPLFLFGKRPLVEFLDFKLPSVDWSSLTPTMTKNLNDSVLAMTKMLEDGEAMEEDILCFPLDRAEGKVYVRRFSKNIVPTLTTTNKYLFLASLDLSKHEKKRKCFRFLDPKAWGFGVQFFGSGDEHVLYIYCLLLCFTTSHFVFAFLLNKFHPFEERMLLQGFPADTLDGCSDALKVQGSGNAYPVPLMVAVLSDIVKEIKTGLSEPSAKEPLDNPSCAALCSDFDSYMGKFGDQRQGSKKQTGLKRPASAKSKVMNEKKEKAVKKNMKKKQDKSKESSKNPKKTGGASGRVRPAYRWIGSSES